jgi:hypothetical protein
MLKLPYAESCNRVGIIRDIINRVPPAQWNQAIVMAPPWVRNLIESTWRLDPNNRPIATQICQEIEYYSMSPELRGIYKPTKWSI